MEVADNILFISSSKEHVVNDNHYQGRGTQTKPNRLQPNRLERSSHNTMLRPWRPCLHATGGKGVCLINHQKDVKKRSDTLKEEGWRTGTPQTIDVIDTPLLKQRTEEWYVARNNCYITGSMVDTLLNHNPHSTYYQEVNRTAGVKANWRVEKKKDGDKYHNRDRPNLSLDKDVLPKLYVPLPDSLVYVILDIEHSEGCYDGIEIIQLAAKLVDINGEELAVGPFNELVKTLRPIVDRCGHNITEKDLEGKDTFDKVGQRFIDWIHRAARRFDTVVFVAYNGNSSDFRFLAREFERNHLVLPKHYDYLCTDPFKCVLTEMHGFFKDVPRQTEAGKPCLKLEDVTTFILENRELYREDRERYEGEDLFERMCGTAHDAMADVEALHIVLTAPIVLHHQKVIKFENFTQYASKFVHFERELAVPSPVDQNNKPINHGNKYEDEARDAYIYKFTSKGIECKYIEIGFVKHPFYSYMGASPDGLLLFKDRNPILIEIKCPYKVYNSGGKLERSNLNRYRGQMQLQMHVMGVHETHFVQYNPGTSELISDVVCYNPDFMKNSIFPQFVADVEAREARMEDVVAPPPKSKKHKKRRIIEVSDDDL